MTCDHLPHTTFFTPSGRGGKVHFMWCPACGSLGVPARYADKGEFVPSHFTKREVQEFEAGEEKFKDYWYHPGKEVRKHFETAQPERPKKPCHQCGDGPAGTLCVVCRHSLAREAGKM